MIRDGAHDVVQLVEPQIGRELQANDIDKASTPTASYTFERDQEKGDDNAGQASEGRVYQRERERADRVQSQLGQRQAASDGAKEAGYWRRPARRARQR
jgi:hypothetical protein